MSGKVTVKIVHLRGIKSADLDGKSDPFCVLSLCKKHLRDDKPTDKGEKKTKIVMNTLNPDYNETFVFDVADSRSQRVFIDVFDYDKLSSNDFLGTAEIPLLFLCDGQMHRFELGFLDDQPGLIQVEVTAEGFGRDVDEKGFEKCHEETYGILAPVTLGKLKVTVVGCEDLIAKDLNGFSDPFCRVSIAKTDSLKKLKNQMTSSKTKSFKTKVIKKNLNPQWNETFELEVKNMKKEYVVFEIYDWDEISKNDRIGFCSYPLEKLQREKVVEVTLPIAFVLKTLSLKTVKKPGKCHIMLQPMDFGFRPRR